ncbi:aminoglycoside phosphotransferase family protein [uncultured Mycolicibacterium sp.]|uniref:phosphotransferase family protein n=1 Tax=uncultured Mycolicibacterium sp. TaxID=2320817 RepID=UPI002611F343|nr:aminoglycoside phosphotransferase family protein [uncultured Mycolicibacterium sp.]
MTAALSIPRSPADVTPQWLGAVLGVPVRHAETEPIGTGQTGATYRVTVAYADAPGDLPASFAVKLPAQDESVAERVALGYRAEHAFYTRVAPHMAVPVPHCYHCEIARDGAEFVMLMADLAPAEQGDQIAGCSPDEARLAVRALAGLHGPSWCRPEWADVPGIAMPRPDDAAAEGLGEIARMAADITLDRLGERMTGQDRDTTRAAMDLVTAWLRTVTDRYALMHGDYRLDNLLFDPDRTRVTVVDWQTMGAGLAARDLAYFIGTSLLPEVRADAERGLVDAYHEALCAHGVTGYDRETCWDDYRLGMLQVPLLTVLGCAFAAATERGDDMMLVMLQRGCRAIRELDSLSLVRAG